MANIIDTLNVELGLDTTKFTQGQQQAAQSLQGLQQAANQAGQNIHQSLGSRLVQFFIGIKAPAAAAHTQISAIGTQAHQTGNIVAAGASRGATGLVALTTAGLSAYAVLKSIQSVAEKI